MKEDIVIQNLIYQLDDNKAKGDTGGTLDRPQKMADLVADSIRKAIIMGELNDGDRLPQEAELIKRYAVSRGVVREALMLLQAQNLIQVKRGAQGGAVVCCQADKTVCEALLFSFKLKKVKLIDCHNANTFIEPPAAAYAARYHSQTAANALRAHYHYQLNLHETQQTLALAKAMNDFHFILIENCGNPVLPILWAPNRAIITEQIPRLHREFKSFQEEEEYQDFVLRALQAAEELILLVENEKSAEADAHWRSHMERAGDYFFSRIQSRLFE